MRKLTRYIVVRAGDGETVPREKLHAEVQNIAEEMVRALAPYDPSRYHSCSTCF